MSVGHDRLARSWAVPSGVVGTIRHMHVNADTAASALPWLRVCVRVCVGGVGGGGTRHCKRIWASDLTD